MILSRNNQQDGRISQFRNLHGHRSAAQRVWMCPMYSEGKEGLAIIDNIRLCLLGLRCKDRSQQSLQA